jgi:hypothetical protein
MNSCCDFRSIFEAPYIKIPIQLTPSPYGLKNAQTTGKADGYPKYPANTQTANYSGSQPQFTPGFDKPGDSHFKILV